MEKRFLNSILNSAADSADEMSLIYDIYGETEVITFRIDISVTFKGKYS